MSNFVAQFSKALKTLEESSGSSDARKDPANTPGKRPSKREDLNNMVLQKVRKKRCVSKKTTEFLCRQQTEEAQKRTERSNSEEIHVRMLT